MDRKLSNSIVCPVCSSKHLFRNDNVKHGVFSANCESCGHFIKFRAKSSVNSQITLTVNGTKYTVGNEYPPWTTLLTFLRKERISPGTKYMCHEGGCGLCIVEAKLYEPLTDSMKCYPINSCLCPLFMCDGWEITTVEGITDVVPKRLASYNGTQCGFCSPGQVMNIQSLLDNCGGQISMKQIEESYDNVICRCTGFRPILDTMKSFAYDFPAKTKATTEDIEELGKAFCKKTGKRCNGKCHPMPGLELQVVGSDAVWYRPATFDQLFQIFTNNPGKKTRLVFGNTGTGVYRELHPSNFDILVDLRGIQDLFNVDFDPAIVLGAGLSINQLMDIFNQSKVKPNLGHLEQVREMLGRVAGFSVRSMGSWAGNLMMKHLHNEFQSDVYASLEAANVQLMIASSSGSTNVPISEFLKTDMTNKVIVSMIVPSMSSDYVVRLYKVAQRAENSHSYINASIRMKINNSNGKFIVTEKPCLVFSGVSVNFVHAVLTEGYLQGKSLADPKVVQGAISTLATEINPDPNIDSVEPSVEYRKNVALGYLYKYILDVLGDSASAAHRCGAATLSRPLSSGQQSYDTKTMEWPLTEPMVKLEALSQTKGQAEYINDIREPQDILYAAFVISTVGNCRLQSMDATAALNLPGVKKFLTAQDIPGENNCFSSYAPGVPSAPEEVLCSGFVNYAGQALGIIIADNEETANRAAHLVTVTYADQKTPVLSISDAIKAGTFVKFQFNKLTKGDSQTAINNSPRKITGSIEIGEQQHLNMETQIAYCVPTDIGMDVQASTQWLDNTQRAVAMILGWSLNKVNLSVKRLGGSYGAKISRNFIVAASCALAAHTMNRPVKLNVEFHTAMKMSGRRFPYRADYTVGCSEQGKLNGIDMNIYTDCGYLANEMPILGAYGFIDNAYYCANWNVVPKPVLTNKPCNTYCRAPGSTPAIFIMESVMEHIAKELNQDPLSVRMLNMYNKGQTTPSGTVLEYCNIRQLTTDFLVSASVQQRKQAIDAFNQANRWKKKGLSVVPMKFELSYFSAHYNTMVNIYTWDGSISIAHGGVESGQGINTKVAQVCAYELGVPIDIITVKANNTVSNANNQCTGGSITSELCCSAVIACCKELMSRMAPVKAKMTNPSWLQLVQKCQNEQVDLSARHVAYDTAAKSGDPAYNTYGVTCTEVELDVLTGQSLINRVDILYDCGESMNPMIDVGQVEGAFVMGLGYYLHEMVKYDPQSGQLLTNSTWEYKPPMAKDIPIDFRVSLLKNAPNPKGILRSKAVGEPPLCMSCSALFALKRCVEAARKDIQKDTFFPLHGPATVDKLCELCLADPSQFTI